ncbi:hypothetical protein [Gemmiger sp.]|uniref:hypothetical protein n=1 Tax=Gemmiger sp. TaxID=2049027 RepID=UPI003FD71D10
MKIIGYRKADFTPKNGEEVKGFNVYVIDDISPEHGQGNSAERIYLTEKKLAGMGNIDVSSLLGHEVKIYYTRYGKVDTIEVLD